MSEPGKRLLVNYEFFKDAQKLEIGLETEKGCYQRFMFVMQPDGVLLCEYDNPVRFTCAGFDFPEVINA